jgi:aminoglycoside 3-N-acetyltransferase
MKEREQSMASITQDDIVYGLRQLELEAGTPVLAHSSLSSFGYVRGGADAVIDALLETVGPKGTVLVPTLTGSETLSAENPPFFDPATTPCWTGRIPECFRQRAQAVRSLHPTHSVAAIGAQAQSLTKGHEYSITPCGPDSPYGRLAQAGGAILLLGVTHSCNTTFHYVEEIVGVSYHMQPRLAAAQVVKNGQTHTIHVMLHRYGAERNFDRLEPVFRERGIQREGQIGRAEVRLIDTRRMVELTRQVLLQDPTLLLA